MTADGSFLEAPAPTCYHPRALSGTVPSSGQRHAGGDVGEASKSPSVPQPARERRADLERLGLCYERLLVAPLPPTSDVETARVARLNAPTTLSPLTASREADR
jgi:hypothetical protein